jgi:hypothetical protein
MTNSGTCNTTAAYLGEAVSQERTRYLRLPQVKARTGLGKTKIYELQGVTTFSDARENHRTCRRLG